MGWLPWWFKLWKWPEYAMKWLKGWHEMWEARAKRRIAELELRRLQRESSVQAMVQKIQSQIDTVQANYSGRSIVPIIEPGEGDDKDIFNEAKRRISERQRRNWSGRFSGRFG